MRASVAAAFTILLSLVLLPMAGCSSLLGDFPRIQGGDGGGSDATTDDGGDAQTMDVIARDTQTADVAPHDSGGDAAAQCSPTSCPSGCCDAAGKCVVYAMQSGTACGTGGAGCGACGTGESCSSGACSCGGTMCNGCCSSAKQCVTTPSNMACGENGTTCQMCAANQECNSQGQCVCDAHTCPNGCCTSAVGGSCIAYASETATQCGSAGAICAACSQPANSTATCSSGACSFTCTGGTTKCSGACVNLQGDGGNCGSCGHSCLGGACTSATCLPYVLAQPPVSSTVLSIASDGTNLLWVDSGKSGVYQIPVAGGAIVTLASGVSFTTPSSVAVANGKYAFTQTAGGPDVHLWSGSLGATNGAVQAGSWSTSSAYGLAMTPDALNVGFIDEPSTANVANVFFVPTTTGVGVPIDSPSCSGSGCPIRSGQQVAANANYFAWTINVLVTNNQCEVCLYNYTTHTKTYPTTAVLYPDFPVLDASNLYYVDNANLQIMKVALPSGSPTLVMDNGNQTFTGLAIDSQNAYFTVNAVPGVFAVALSGTQSPVPLFSGGSPQQIIQVGGALFWIDSSTQKIYGMRYP